MESPHPGDLNDQVAEPGGKEPGGFEQVKRPRPEVQVQTEEVDVRRLAMGVGGGWGTGQGLYLQRNNKALLVSRDGGWRPKPSTQT